MPLATSPDDEEVLALLHEALGLERDGLLTTDVLEDIEEEIRLLCMLSRRKGRRRPRTGLREEADARLDRETDLNAQAESALTPELRVVYNLLNARFGNLVPHFTVVEALSDLCPGLAEMDVIVQQAVVQDVIDELGTMILLSGNDRTTETGILLFPRPPCFAYRLVRCKR